MLTHRRLTVAVSLVLSSGLALVGCREVPVPAFPAPPSTTAPTMTTTPPVTATSAAPTTTVAPTTTTTTTAPTTTTRTSARPPLTSIPTVTTTTPTTTTEPPRKAPPVGSTELFVGFDDLDLGEFSNMQAEGVNGDPSGVCGRVCAVNAGPGHETAARFEVRPGDEAAGGERAELRVGDEGDTAPGDERWYEFDLMFEDFPRPGDTDSGGHLIVMQWHTGSGSPLLTLNVDGEDNFTVGERWDDPDIIGPIDEGVWHSYVVHVVFSEGDDGLVEVWRDGTKVATRNQATHRDSDNYLKLGVYQGESDTRSLLYDDLIITAP